MKKNILKLLPYLITLTLTFYLSPLLIVDTGSGMLLLLIIIPLILLLTSTIYGVKEGLNFIFTIITMILFIPTIFIFYNSSAYIYIIIYGVLSLIGNVIGNLFNKILKYNSN